MSIKLAIRKSSIEKIFLIPRPKAGEWMMLSKRTVARWLLYLGIFIAYYGTLNPWFLWSISRYVNYLAAMPLAVAMLFSRNIRQGIFNRQDYIFPIVALIVLQLVMALTSGKNINGLIVVGFSSIVYLALLRLDRDELHRLADLLTTSMACILSVSIPFYLLFLAGFNLPHSHIIPTEWDYSFENYRFFLIDDRAANMIIPRFTSVFLEPSHLGMACIALLYSQIGKWKTWRCRIVITALILSFSLAAYLCFIVLIFSSAWMKGKAIIGKVLILSVLTASVVVGSIFYKDGENPVNVLIVQRLTMNDDGEIEGDNRTSDLFTKEYNKMASSSQIILGRGTEAMERFGGSGNAGYRVYLYTYGLISVLFLLVFFYAIFATSDNTRAKIAMSVISMMSFVAHAIPIKYYFFIPLYILLFSNVYPASRHEEENDKLRK